MRLQRELRKGVTEISVLAALGEAPGYGYELAQRLRRRSGGTLDLGDGTLYPLLYKLEARGLIGGRWENAAGERRRRVYRISARGRKRLVAVGTEWRRLVEGMSLVLGGVAHA